MGKGFLIFFTAINLVNYIDRYIMMALLPTLQDQFAISQAQAGLLGAAYVPGYITFAPIFGYLGDRYSRPKLMAVGVMLWSLATALTAAAGSFEALMVARVLVGVGEASFVAMAPGFIRDRDPDPARLSTTFGIFYAAIPVGAALGYVLGGTLTEMFSWHAAFLVGGLPGIVMAFGLFGLAETGTREVTKVSVLEGLRQIASIRILWFAMGGYVLNTFALNSVATFVTGYGESIGFSLAGISSLFGGILVVAGMVGTSLGGVVASRFARAARDPAAALLLFAGLTAILGAPLLYLAFSVSNHAAFLCLCFLAELVVFAGIAPVNSVIVMRSPKAFVTLTQGMSILTQHLLGTLPGSYITGAIADGYSIGAGLRMLAVVMLLSGLVWTMGRRTSKVGGPMSNAAQNVRSSLRILPDESPLRRPRPGEAAANPFLDEVRWPPAAETDPPRALRALARIVDGGLCHRCGSCVGICPTGVLALDRDEYPKVGNLSACTDCDLCVKVCPGDEFDFHSACREMYGSDGNLEETHGTFSRAVIAYAADKQLRENSTSGGLVTAILLHLFDTGKIDGAIVIGSDQDQLWKGKPMVARTREQILGATKSKYAISPTNSVFAEIRTQPGRYALVGLPCQIHGFNKAARLDERLRERVVLTIGLFCHAAIEHEAFEIIWKSLGDKAKRAKRFTSRIGKHPGAPHIELEDGTLYPVYFGDKQGYRPSSMDMINILYRLYTPDRCLTCFDALAEFADIAVGDPWLAPPDDDVDFYQGWSFALLRTERGAKIYSEVSAAGAIAEKEVTRREALACNSLMAGEKRWRAFRVIETHRRQGLPIPQYTQHDIRFPAHSGMQFVKTELHMLTHIFCYIPRLRAAVLRFFLGSGGYYLLWLNSLRRRFRFWRRDTLALLRRKLRGRV